MKLLFSRYAFVSLLTLLVAFNTFAAECDDPKGSEEISRCVGSDLYAADINLNLMYKSLAGSLIGADKDHLRADQLAWLKERNRVCGLTNKETDREKWHEDLMKDFKKAICVTRYSKVRTIELDDMMTQHKFKIAAAAHPQQDYQLTSNKLRESGFWYYEVKVNAGAISRSGSAIIWSGCGEEKTHSAAGVTFRIRPGQNLGETLIGIAIDLEQGKFYHSENGVWQDGEPGSSGGLDIKLGRTYRCGIDSSELVKPLLEKQYLDVNFGERPFIYEPPQKYAPYRGEANWLVGGIDTTGMRTSFDYASFDIKSIPPTLSVMQEYPELKGLKEIDKKYKAVQSQLEIDCGALKADGLATFFVSDRHTYVATSGYPFKIEQQPGLDTVGGRLIKTVCFLSSNKFELPAISAAGNWDAIVSPSPNVRIFESPERRQSKNGYLLVTNKNEMTSYTTVNGEQSKLIVAVSALNCKDLTMHQLIGIRYGDQGNIVGADYYIDESNFPTLPENRKRLIDACASVSSTAITTPSPTVLGR